MNHTKPEKILSILLIAAAILCCKQLCATDFHRLIREGDFERIKKSISLDSRLVNIKDELGRSPLQIATVRGNLALVNVLIKAKADVNHVDRLKGFTALHYAALYNYPRILSFLLARGADMAIQDNDGNFPLHICAGNGCIETVRILLEHQADANCMNRRWQIPLHYCAMAGKDRQMFPYASKNVDSYLEIAELLVKSGAYSNLRDINDDTPATVAARHYPGSDFFQHFVTILEGLE
jgi:ankyrin repeat protein